jgi:NADH pyrophosphatase NudC (nudix superfamily)
VTEQACRGLNFRPTISLLEEKFARITVHMNMKARFRLFSRRSRPRQLKLNLWPKRQNTLRQILERIRDDTQQALKLLGDGAELRSLEWECRACDHVKHFTRPVPRDVARLCPKCGGESFQAL